MIRFKSGKSEKKMKTKMDETSDDNTKEVVGPENDMPANAKSNIGSVKTSQGEEAVEQVEQVENADSSATIEDILTADNKAGSVSIEDLQLKINDLNDRYLRLYSEFDNYRKRTLKERIELSKTASTEVISALLPVVDDFDRAIKSWDLIDTEEAHLEGITLINNKLQNILAQRGLEEIPALGLPFNTDFHEAITQIPAPTPELKDKIVDVVEKGYSLQGKVIRFAKVVVGS